MNFYRQAPNVTKTLYVYSGPCYIGSFFAVRAPKQSHPRVNNLKHIYHPRQGDLFLALDSKNGKKHREFINPITEDYWLDVERGGMYQVLSCKERAEFHDIYKKDRKILGDYYDHVNLAWIVTFLYLED